MSVIYPCELLISSITLSYILGTTNFVPIIKMVTVRVVIQIIVRTTVKTIAKIIVRIIARMDIIKVHIIQMRITAKTTEHKTTINQIMRLLVF